jgi:hypothetical protein
VTHVHTGSGEAAQVDFGSAGTLLDPRADQPRRAWVFVMTLGYSRHQYAELVFDQKVSTWIACNRRAFEAFGGVPRRIVPDNLKAAILEASLHDPLLGEACRRCAQHYAFMISPTRPRTPEHKGKVENGIHFVKRSFLAGQQFADLPAANQALRECNPRAPAREHGTTRRAPRALFEAEERVAPRPLPAAPFELVETRRATVHLDCHVVLDGSYYSVPHRYVGQRLDAWVFAPVVQLFSGTELVAPTYAQVVAGSGRPAPSTTRLRRRRTWSGRRPGAGSWRAPSAPRPWRSSRICSVTNRSIGCARSRHSSGWSSRLASPAWRSPAPGRATSATCATAGSATS